MVTSAFRHSYTKTVMVGVVPSHQHLQSPDVINRQFREFAAALLVTTHSVAGPTV